MSGAEPLRLAVLLSGGGRTLENLLARIEAEELPLRVVAVASNKPGVRGLAVAAAAGLVHRAFRLSEHDGDARARDAAMAAWLRAHDPSLLVLAGYLALLHLEEFGGLPAVNIHPSLLPAHGGEGMYGDRVHRAVLEAGDGESGCTVHAVDAEYDRGAVLAQARVPVRPGDDARALADRVFAAECQLYPDTLARIARGELGLPGLDAGGART